MVVVLVVADLLPNVALSEPSLSSSLGRLHNTFVALPLSRSLAVARCPVCLCRLRVRVCVRARSWHASSDCGGGSGTGVGLRKTSARAPSHCGGGGGLSSRTATAAAAVGVTWRAGRDPPAPVLRAPGAPAARPTERRYKNS